MHVVVLQGGTGPNLSMFSEEKRCVWFYQAIIKLRNNLPLMLKMSDRLCQFPWIYPGSEDAMSIDGRISEHWKKTKHNCLSKTHGMVWVGREGP